MRKTVFNQIFTLAFMCLFTGLNAQSDTWTHFRGTNLDGIAAPGNYPTTWNDSLNVQWKTEIPGRGWSSPVVLNGEVWVTSATPDGKNMFAECIDLHSGEIIHHIDIFQPEKIYRKHSVNSYATPTSVIEDGYLYVHFGRYGTACISTETGKVLWKRTDMQCEHVQGPGSSLFVHGEKLIVHMEGTDVQDIYALDKSTGETIWKAQRDQELIEQLEDIGKKAYVTPIVINVKGRELLISNGSAASNAYDIETGEEVWFIPQGEDSTISMPSEYNGKIIFFTSFVTPESGEKYIELWAVDPVGEGDLTDQIIWRKKFPVLQLSTQVVYEGLIYTVDSRSTLHCINADTGETVWTEKLRGKFNASPIVANDLVYVTDTRGETFIFKTGKSYEPVGTNSLPGEVWATPAFVNGSILMRTSIALYRISN